MKSEEESRAMGRKRSEGLTHSIRPEEGNKRFEERRKADRDGYLDMAHCAGISTEAQEDRAITSARRISS